MIIGNNNPLNKTFGNNNVNTTQPSENNNFTQSFDKRFNMVKEQAKKNARVINTYATNNNTMQHSNVMSKSEMADKSFSMLQERFNNGLISLDEFNKKCSQLNKLRQKQ
jgi:hypothetical protein